MKKVIIFIVSLLLIMTLPCITGAQGAANQNLLTNGGFETAGQDQTPDSWRADFWHSGSTLTVTTQKTHQGKYALLINSDKDTNDARMIQTVQVKPNTYYKLSGWVSTENVSPDKIGANLCVVSNTFTNSSSLNGTMGWTYLEYNFRTYPKQTEVTVSARLGMWGNDVKGAAYFDDLSLVELNSAPANCQVLQPPPAVSSSTNTSTSGAKTPAKLSPVKTVLIIVLILLVVVIIYMFFKGKQGKNGQEPQDEQNPQDVQDIEEEGTDDGNEDQER